MTFLSRLSLSLRSFVFVWLAVVTGLPVAALAQDAAAIDPAGAVVKVYVAAIASSHDAPWRPGQSYGASGSGAVIEDGRILTNAHVIQGQTFVQVRANGRPEKYPARVSFVSNLADLALLEVDAREFHDGR